MLRCSTHPQLLSPRKYHLTIHRRLAFLPSRQSAWVKARSAPSTRAEAAVVTPTSQVSPSSPSLSQAAPKAAVRIQEAAHSMGGAYHLLACNQMLYGRSQLQHPIATFLQSQQNCSKAAYVAACSLCPSRLLLATLPVQGCLGWFLRKARQPFSEVGIPWYTVVQWIGFWPNLSHSWVTQWW